MCEEPIDLEYNAIKKALNAVEKRGGIRCPRLFREADVPDGDCS